MKRISIAVLCVLSVGCAAKGYFQPKPATSVVSYMNAMAEQKPVLVNLDGECTLVAMLKSGKELRAELDERVCEDAAVWLAAEKAAIAAIPPAPKPTVSAAPKPAEAPVKPEVK